MALHRKRLHYSVIRLSLQGDQRSTAATICKLHIAANLTRHVNTVKTISFSLIRSSATGNYLFWQELCVLLIAGDTPKHTCRSVLSTCANECNWCVWRLQLNKVGNFIDELYFYWHWPSFFIEGCSLIKVILLANFVLYEWREYAIACWVKSWRKQHGHTIDYINDTSKFERKLIHGNRKLRWSQRFCDPIVRSVSKRNRDAVMSCVLGCSWLWAYISAIRNTWEKIATQKIYMCDAVKWYHLPDSDSFDTWKFKEACVAAVAGICIQIEEKSAQTLIKTRKTSGLWHLSNDFVIY